MIVLATMAFSLSAKLSSEHYSSDYFVFSQHLELHTKYVLTSTEIGRIEVQLNCVSYM